MQELDWAFPRRAYVYLSLVFQSLSPINSDVKSRCRFVYKTTANQSFWPKPRPLNLSSSPLSTRNVWPDTAICCCGKRNSPFNKYICRSRTLPAHVLNSLDYPSHLVYLYWHASAAINSPSSRRYNCDTSYYHTVLLCLHRCINADLLPGW